MKSFKKWMVVPFEEEKEDEQSKENKKYLEINKILSANKLNDEEKLINYNKEIRKQPIKNEDLEVKKIEKLKNNEKIIKDLQSKIDALKLTNKNDMSQNNKVTEKIIKDMQNQIDIYKLINNSDISNLKNNMDSLKKHTHEEYNNINRKVDYIQKRNKDSINNEANDNPESDNEEYDLLESTYERQPFLGTRQSKRRRKEKIKKLYNNVTERKKYTQADNILNSLQNLSIGHNFRWEHDDNNMSITQ